MRVAVTACLVLACAFFARSAEAQDNRRLIDDPGFERTSATGNAAGWRPYEQGFEVDRVVRRGGDRSIRCVNATAEERRGAVWTLNLNQKTPAPLLVTGWSRAEGVGGNRDYDYSLYIDLVYTDGTPLYGQTADFSVGTHDWQRRQVLVVPAKPIRSATIYALFRRHRGTAWFDDVSATELSGNDLFDGQSVRVPTLPAGQREGWFARDVAAGSPVLPFRGGKDQPSPGTAESLGLWLQEVRGTDPAVTRIVHDGTGKDRAVTVYYLERFDGSNPVWWNDIGHSMPTGSNGEWTNLMRAGDVGANGSLSLYPFGCVTGAGKGRMVGIPPLLGPRIARIGYHAGAKLLYVAFDIALTGKSRTHRDSDGHGRAMLAIVRADTDPGWGFRAAADAYYRMFPEAFRRRATAEGIWIPFTDPSTVQDVADFGIAYHEGDNSVAFDDRRGILSFRYTEPMTWWMPMPETTPRTYDAAMALVREHLAGKDENMKRWAQAVIHSGSHDEAGKVNVQFQNAPWTNGAVWVLNPNPRLPHPPDEWTKARLTYTAESADARYSPERDQGLDGEYLDSTEGWGNVLDFRPETLEHALTPPTFTTDGYRPVIPTWFSVYELAASMSRDLHRRNRLLMANSTPWRYWAFLPLLDVAGTETNWLPGGTWRPDSDAVFNLRRTLSYHKPYLLLQNTDFDRFGPEQVERYFQHSMFYGVYPSMFSADASTNPYWKTPRWYNRDRALFRKYIPAIQTLSRAGWEPITHARADNASILLERFGRKFLTVRNTAADQVRTTIALEPEVSGGWARIVKDLVTGEVVVPRSPTGITRVVLDMKPGEIRALQVGEDGTMLIGPGPSSR